MSGALLRAWTAYRTAGRNKFRPSVDFEAGWIAALEQSNLDVPVEQENCPRCGETFFAPANHDPLRKHMDYCEGEVTI